MLISICCWSRFIWLSTSSWWYYQDIVQLRGMVRV